MSKKKIIVTGGAGYIGSHVCKKLYHEGYEPICYDNLSTGHKEFVKWGPLIKADITNKKNLVRVIEKYDPIAIMNFAALSLVEESNKNLYKYFFTNYYGTLCILEAMHLTQKNKLIQSSTAAVYGFHGKKYKEESKLKPINNYGKSKLAAEESIKYMGKLHQINYIILRYFNAAGADFDSKIGELHYPETHLIPNITNSIFNGNHIKIYGNDYQTRDGTCIRDFVHVEDIADAHFISLKYLLNKRVKEIYNIGTGKGSSVLKVVNKFENLLNTKYKVEYLKRRDGDPAILVADINKFQKKFNWKPSYSSLEKILSSEINWRKTYSNCL